MLTTTHATRSDIFSDLRSTRRALKAGPDAAPLARAALTRASRTLWDARETMPTVQFHRLAHIVDAFRRAI